MKEIVPPSCLVLSLLLFIAGFAALAFDRPEPNVALHRAIVEGDEQRREVLQRDLQQRRTRRVVLIVSLFGMAVVTAAIAYVGMRPSSPN